MEPELNTAMETLANQVKDLMEMVRTLQAERDALQIEVSRQYHAWSRDDLEDWADEKGVEITEDLWRNWCIFWCDIYNLEYEQEAMRMAMDDWWQGITDKSRQ